MALSCSTRRGTCAIRSGHRPVLWDGDGRLRDLKHPTPGPLERGPKTVCQRYVHDGGQALWRETYHDKDAGPAQVTRFLHSFPGGPTAFADGDGVLDVHLTDSLGRPWLAYRAREGAVPDTDPRTGLHLHGLPAKGLACRNTSLLNSSPVAAWPWLGSRPWYLDAVEPDYLLGRRGQRGWDGKFYDAGVCITIPQKAEPSWWDEVMMGWGGLSRGERWLIGTALVVIAAGLTIITFGGAAPLLSAAAGKALLWTSIGGAALFSGGLAAYEYGGHLAEEHGSDNPWARGLQAFGKTGMVLGGMALAGPWIGAIVKAGAAWTTALSPWFGAAYKLGLYGTVGYGVHKEARAMYHDWGDPDVDWIEWVDRHGPAAAHALRAGGMVHMGSGARATFSCTFAEQPLQQVAQQFGPPAAGEAVLGGGLPLPDGEAVPEHFLAAGDHGGRDRSRQAELADPGPDLVHVGPEPGPLDRLGRRQLGRGQGQGFGGGLEDLRAVLGLYRPGQASDRVQIGQFPRGPTSHRDQDRVPQQGPRGHVLSPGGLVAHDGQLPQHRQTPRVEPVAASHAQVHRLRRGLVQRQVFQGGGALLPGPVRVAQGGQALLDGGVGGRKVSHVVPGVPHLHGR